MVEPDLGTATIVYEDPDEGIIEETVENEHVAYFQDHWIVKTGEHEEGHDVVRRIPAQRVYYVERNVDKFEEEVRTLRDEVQSFADDLGIGVQSLRDRLEAVTEELQSELSTDTGRSEGSDAEVKTIDVEGDESEGSDSGSDADSLSDSEADEDHGP